MTKLVVVESPAKVKSIGRYLPKEYKVDSCVGHIRDLPSRKTEIPASIKDKPWADLAVDVENDFQPHYVTIRGKGKVIQQLKAKLKDADELLLATDEDREGESISWHLIQVLKPKVPVRRMVFNEITKDAIQRALANPRDLDMHLVQAQETRRILDRLYGYTLSPLLWKKIGGNLSAGRVQSVAVRLIVERERERRAFRSGAYWDLKASLAHQGQDFDARLLTVDGQRIATGKDFDKDTGKIAEGREVLLLEEDRARQLQASLVDATWTVLSVEANKRQSSPMPPFITSTLQQEANNRLNLGARDTMRVAQRLYENGFITYMRTDSTQLSDEAIRAARAVIEQRFGREYLPPSPRSYQHKKTKGAQEAHEAIRPAGSTFTPPEKTGLKDREFDLYKLIWDRTLACQMVNEQFTSTAVTVEAKETTFGATGKAVDFPGYRRAYPALGEAENPLPRLAEGDHPDCKNIDAEGHETKPPARYTEATLVRALEEAGVGRPSTYADIMERIQGKGYVIKKGKALVPSFTAFAVTGLLEKHFPNLVDSEFTAKMEQHLDEIAAGEAEWLPYLRAFYQGSDGLREQVDKRLDQVDPGDAREIQLEGMPFTVKVGRYGPYVETEIDGERVSASIPETVTPDELTKDFVAELVRQKREGPPVLGKDPDTGEPVYVMNGRFGPYFQLGDGDGSKKPPRASIPRGIDPQDAKLADALFLLKLPKTLGHHPADAGRVLAGLGRFGPFVAHEPADGSKTEYRSLKSMEDLRVVTLDEALQLLAQPKRGRGAGRRTRQVLQDFGKHPDDGKPVQLLDGRYGPYVNHGKTNATVPKGQDPAKLTMEEALALLEKKRAS